MPEIEVQATRTFQHPLHPNGRFLIGRSYQVDTDNPWVQGLVAGGYFKVMEQSVEVTDGQVDPSGFSTFLAGGVGTRRTRPARAKKEPEQIDGQDPTEPVTD